MNSNYGFSSESIDSDIDRMIEILELSKENDLDSFKSLGNEICNRIDSSTDYSSLLLVFWGFLVTMYKNGYTVFSEFAAKVAFFAMNELIKRNNYDASRDLVIYTRDDLFLVYLSDKRLYYAIINALYLQVMGGYPDIYKDGFVSVYNKINNFEDNGYMDADYVFAAAWSAELALKIGTTIPNVSEDDLAMYKAIKDMYYDFSSFANGKYGFQQYNRPKEKQLYKRALDKPYGYIPDSEDKLRRRPIWAAIAYATAEASGEYEERYQVAKILGMENNCSPSQIELNIMSIRKKNRMISIGWKAVLCLILVGMFFAWKQHPIIICAIIAIIAYAAIDDSGMPTKTFYAGHYYSGPAYWLGTKW